MKGIAIRKLQLGKGQLHDGEMENEKMAEPEPEGEEDVVEPSVTSKKETKSKSRQLGAKWQMEPRKLLKKRKRKVMAAALVDSGQTLRCGLSSLSRRPGRWAFRQRR